LGDFFFETFHFGYGFYWDRGLNLDSMVPDGNSKTDARMCFIIICGLESVSLLPFVMLRRQVGQNSKVKIKNPGKFLVSKKEPKLFLKYWKFEKNLHIKC
jgi:hypothetical protein